MSSGFNAKSTTDQVLAGTNLANKTFLITGTSSGLGIETARALVAKGANVIGTVRSIPSAQQACSEIFAAAANGGGSFSFLEMELGSLQSVRACADKLLALGRSIDVVIANAGIGMPPFSLTTEKFEMQFGVNHLGHFVFINRVAKLIPEGGRVVMLSSVAHRFANADFTDPNCYKTRYDPMLSYARSKTANALFAVEFDRKHRGRGVRATSVHPGGIHTGLERHMTPEQSKASEEGAKAAYAAAGVFDFAFKSVAQGAATTVWAAVVADINEIGGRYCEDCSVAEVKDDDGIMGVKSYALDPKRARALWLQSEDFVRELFI